MATRARTVPANTTDKPEIEIISQPVAESESVSGLEVTEATASREMPAAKPRSRATKRSAAPAAADPAGAPAAGTSAVGTSAAGTSAVGTSAVGTSAAGTSAAAASAAAAGDPPADQLVRDPLPRAVGAEAAAAGLTMDPAHVPLRPGEEPWLVAELVAIAEQLRSERARLATELSRAMGGIVELVTATDGAGDDQVDSGNQTFEREQEMSLAANIENLLDQTDRALVRLQTGSYGTCETCGNPVGKYRLQAYPRATLCVPCKQREERR